MKLENLSKDSVITPQLCKRKGQSTCDCVHTHVRCCLPWSPGVSCDPLSSHVASHVLRAGQDGVWLEPDTYLSSGAAVCTCSLFAGVSPQPQKHLAWPRRGPMVHQEPTPVLLDTAMNV